MTNGTVWHQGGNTSSLFNDKNIQMSKIVLEHWKKCPQSQSRRETKVNSYSTMDPGITMGLNVLRFNWKNSTLLTLKEPPCPARHSSLEHTYLCLESVCLYASIPGCLFAWHLPCLAKFCLNLICHPEDLWRPSHCLALWISANSMPVSAVRDWQTPTQS